MKKYLCMLLFWTVLDGSGKNLANERYTNVEVNQMDIKVNVYGDTMNVFTAPAIILVRDITGKILSRTERTVTLDTIYEKPVHGFYPSSARKISLLLNRNDSFVEEQDISRKAGVEVAGGTYPFLYLKSLHNVLVYKISKGNFITMPRQEARRNFSFVILFVFSCALSWAIGAAWALLVFDLRAVKKRFVESSLKKRTTIISLSLLSLATGLYLPFCGTYEYGRSVTWTHAIVQISIAIVTMAVVLISSNRKNNMKAKLAIG